MFEGEPDIVRNKQVEVAVAVEVNKRAPRAPPLLLAPQSRASRYIGESSVSVVTIKNVLAEICAENIFESVVVVIPDADAASPTHAVKPRLLRNVGERSVAIILVQPIRRAIRSAFNPRAAKDKQIHPSVIVVVNEGASAAGGFQNVFLGVHAAVDHRLA